MAIYNYTRELQQDGRYNIGYFGESPSLARRIKDIFTSYDINVKCNGTNVYVNISQNLTTEEKSTLDSLIIDHKNNLNDIPLPFKCTNDFLDISNIDINLYGLYKEEIFDSYGCLVEKNYYKNFDGSIYSDLYIKDTYNYTILSNDLVYYRDEEITWYLTDGSIGFQKSFRKYYIKNGDYTDAIKEGIKRRENLVEIAKSYGLSNITGTYEVSGEPSLPNSHYFFNSILSEVELYKFGTNKNALIDVISNSSESFLTQTIKDNLVSILKYW